MEATDVPVNYLGKGVWHYEADLTSGHWELDVTPHLFLYSMILPTGEVIEGSIPSLMTKMENYHRDPELSDWVLSVLNWEDQEAKFKKHRKSISFPVENKVYTIDLNPKTGELRLHFPRQVVIVDKHEIGTYYPEVYSIKQGSLSETLNTIVHEALDVLDKPITWSELPLEFSDFRVYDIDGWQFSVSFQPIEDMILLDMEGRTETTHISTFEHDVWEVNNLHNGKYLDALRRALADCGFGQ